MGAGRDTPAAEDDDDEDDLLEMLESRFMPHFCSFPTRQDLPVNNKCANEWRDVSLLFSTFELCANATSLGVSEAFDFSRC